MVEHNFPLLPLEISSFSRALTFQTRVLENPAFPPVSPYVPDFMARFRAVQRKRAEAPIRDTDLVGAKPGQQKCDGTMCDAGALRTLLHMDF
jgi:hypothetical protein